MHIWNLIIMKQLSCIRQSLWIKNIDINAKWWVLLKSQAKISPTLVFLCATQHQTKYNPRGGGGTWPNFGRGRAIEASKTYPFLIPNFPKCVPDFIPIFQKYIPDFIPILWKRIPDPIPITKIVKIDTVPYTKIVKIDTVRYTKIVKIDTLPDGTSPYPKYV